MEGQPVDRRADEYARTDGTDCAEHRLRDGDHPSSLFVIFVIMALFTTLMATPLLALIEKIAGYKSRKVRPTRNGHPRITDFVRQSRKRAAVPEIGAPAVRSCAERR